MKPAALYKCLSDETRLRILNLLSVSPLCVCHIQRILGKSQVIVSQHLSSLRQCKLVASQRYQHWMIYSLPAFPPALLEINLKALRECLQENATFQRDQEKLNKLVGSESVRALLDKGCCAVPTSPTRQTGRTRQTFSTETSHPSNHT